MAGAVPKRPAKTPRKLKPPRQRSGGTSTSSFGVGRRENHDATAFYARFAGPELTNDDRLEPLHGLVQGELACIGADSRRLVRPDGQTPLPDNCVALVVTSPPYFSGKEYEQALGEGHIPATYLDYLTMLRDVFAECKRVLEPGGRIAVNVANLGRKPYRSLSADVIRILQDDLHLLLRGEVIWRKGEGANGSCAWGSFRSAANPVLRDVTERVIIASKGRFDRAKPPDERMRRSLPYETEISPDEFMEATLDVWNIPPESAKRVNHPAPFPIELPQRLIGLYTYRDDLVLDPFMGSGTTLVAAIRGGRRYLGYDMDPEYVAVARERVAGELASKADQAHDDETAGASQEGKVVLALAEDLLVESGFRIAGRNARVRGLGVTVSFVAHDAAGGEWFFDVSGAFTTTRSGLWRTDNVLGSLGRASVLTNNQKAPVVFLTSHRPKPKGDGDLAIRAVGPGAVFDVIAMLDAPGRERLKLYAKGGCYSPEVGYWTDAELARE
jgi:site-specific DNA-methyltransferase (adenine-specific)